MGVDEAWQKRLSTEVDHLRALAPVLHDLGLSADSEDAPVF